MRHSLFTLALAFAISAVPALAKSSRPATSWSKALGARNPEGRRGRERILVIENKGAVPDRLTGGTADFAAVEVHQMTTENGVSKMREVEGCLAIPAHGSVGLSPGGYHVMFTHLTHPLVKGETVNATLKFEHAGPVEVEFTSPDCRRARRHEGDGRHEDVKGLMRSRAQAICFDRERSSRGRGRSALGHVGLISLARDRSRCLPLRPFSWRRC